MNRPSLSAFVAAPLLFLSCSDDEKPGPVPVESPESSLSPHDLPYYQRVKDEVQMLTRAVAASPDDPDLRARLGEKLLQGLLTEQGEAQLEAALELDPGHERAAIALFESRFSRGLHDEAYAVLKSALEVRETAELRAREGRFLAFEGGDQRAAEAALRRALELDRNCAEAATELARLLLERGDHEEAIPLLQEVCRRKTNDLAAHYNLARALRRAGRTEEAEVVAARHRRLSYLDDLGFLDRPDSPDASVALAYMFSSGGDFDAALAELDQALERHGDRADLLAERGLTLFKAGRVEEAIDALEQGLARHRDAPQLLNRLAWILATRPRDERDRRRARNLAERAVRLTDGKDPDVLDTAAEARAGMGDVRGAIAALREAARIDPHNPARTRRLNEFETAKERDR